MGQAKPVARTVLEDKDTMAVEGVDFLPMDMVTVIQKEVRFSQVCPEEFVQVMAKMVALEEVALLAGNLTATEAEAGVTLEEEVQILMPDLAVEAVPIILELVKKIFPGLVVAMDSSVFTVPREWLQPCPKLRF